MFLLNSKNEMKYEIKKKKVQANKIKVNCWTRLPNKIETIICIQIRKKKETKETLSVGSKLNLRRKKSAEQFYLN